MKWIIFTLLHISISIRGFTMEAVKNGKGLFRATKTEHDFNEARRSAVIDEMHSSDSGMESAVSEA